MIEQMATDERNFRSSYYEKVGCRSVEEKKSLEILLKEKPWDRVKLKQFGLRFTIPATYRNLLWKVQLGVLPVFTDSHACVTLHRQAQYNDLLHALRIMKIVDNSTPKPQLFLAMFLLETGKLHYGVNLQMDNVIVPISETLIQMYDDDVDVYWLAKGFHNFVEQFSKDIPKFLEQTKGLLEKEDPELYKFLQEKNAIDSLPLEKWFGSCFAGTLDESALVKIWDKICGGSTNILISVAVTIVMTLRRNILKARNSEQILKCLQEIPEEAEEVIANKAIEHWQHYGSMVPAQGESIHTKGKNDVFIRSISSNN